MRVKKIEDYLKKEVRALLRIRIKSYIVWAKRACLVVYKNQISKEKSNNMALEHNNIGYNRFDSVFMSRMVHKIKSGQSLTESQKKEFCRRMSKYTDQIYMLSDSNKLRQLCNNYYKEDGLSLGLSNVHVRSSRG